MELNAGDIEKIHNGDQEAFRTLYESFYVALCVFARGLKLTREDAEDIVQEVFLRIYYSRHKFESISSLKAYLYTSVRNASLNYIRDNKRRKGREKMLFDLLDQRTFFDDIVENEVFRQLHALMSELPTRCRSIFQRSLEGASSKQIAEEMHLSVETVKTQRKKAKRILKERYALLFRHFAILL